MNDRQLNTSPPRGMRDFLPEEAALRDWAASVLVKTYEQFGFSRIETSTLEDINNLRRSEGGENLQLIFEILKRGDKLKKELAAGNVDPQALSDMGLRFDLTVPLVRFYAANQSKLLSPFKAIQIGHSWRAEAPQTQAGRYRQFTQCDIDILGLSSPVVEMELLQATAAALLALGLEGCFFRINDRRVLSALVQYCEFPATAYDSVWIALDKLDKVGLDGVEKELDQIDGAASSSNGTKTPTHKLIGVLQAVQAAGDDFDRLCDALPSVPELREVLQQLGAIIDVTTQQSQGRYSIKFDPTLARGMGYYTGPIFEAGLEGFPSSIGGGGRYDKMIGKYLGRDVPACGFSIGFERAVSILLERGFIPPRPEQVALIYDTNDIAESGAVLACADRLRSKGLRVCVLPRKKEMRKQLDQLVAQGFKQYAVFKPEEDVPELRTLGHGS
jgi:histidyl-tRNA synthetase